MEKSLISKELLDLQRYTFYGLYFSDELDKKIIPSEKFVKEKNFIYY